MAELVTWGSQETADRIPVHVPIPHKHISALQIFRQYIADLLGGVSIILLCFDPQNLNSVLAETEKKKDQIFRIFICCNTLRSLPDYQLDIRHISEYLITYTITASISRLLQIQSQKQFDVGNIQLGSYFEELRKHMAKSMPLNDGLKACHILIIPLNATDRNLYKAQQRLQKICDDLCPELKFRVFTLYDYIPRDESNPDNPSHRRIFEYKQKGDICRLIQRLSLIRMYLIGNEANIENKWSSRLIRNELDITHEHASQYNERCTLIENQLVLNNVKTNLASTFGRAWQTTTIEPKNLNTVRDDIVFQDALYRIHGCLENREMAANAELRQRISESQEDITVFSSEIHAIGYARGGPEEKVDTGDLNDKILSLWQQPNA